MSWVDKFLPNTFEGPKCDLRQSTRQSLWQSEALLIRLALTPKVYIPHVASDCDLSSADRFDNHSSTPTTLGLEVNRLLM